MKVGLIVTGLWFFVCFIPMIITIANQGGKLGEYKETQDYLDSHHLSLNVLV